MELAGGVAVVTGAASGIGLAMAQRFLAEGMHVVMADVERGALEEAASSLGGETTPVVTDVALRQSVLSMAETARAAGPVRILCNNAGVGGARGGPTWEVDQREWEWVAGVNLWGVLHGVQALAPDMVARDEGHIVNTASVAGLLSIPFLSPYSATKHAVVGLSKSILTELSMLGSAVGVSVLCPGFIRTNIADSERNWPDRLGPAPERPESQQGILAEAVGAQISAGMDPVEVASMVLEAVTEKRFWVLPNTEAMHGALRDQTEGMLSGRNPQMPTLA